MRLLRNVLRGAASDAFLAPNGTVSGWYVGLLASVPTHFLQDGHAVMDMIEHVVYDQSNSANTSFVHPNPHSAGPAGGGEYMRAVSCTLQCVMALNIVALLVYTALSVARNKDELEAAQRPSVITQALTVSGRTAAYMPMLCMLFVACRMYVLATTQGLGEPPDWVKGCMRAASAGVILQILIPLFLPMFVKPQQVLEASLESEKTDLPPVEQEVEPGLQDLAGEQNDVHPIIESQEFTEENSGMKDVFWGLQVAALMLIYTGVAGVIVGIATFPAQSTKVSPAVLCTIALSVIYFAVYLGLFLIRTEGQEEQLNAALSMSSVVRKAPMCAVFFLVSRMRALQLNPPYGMPPVWMQGFFFVITACIFIETFAAGAVGYTGQKIKGYYGVYCFRNDSVVAHAVQHGSAMVAYLAFFPCVAGVYMMKDQAGVYGEIGAAAPLSTTMKCVIVFSAVYFGNAMLQTVTLFLEDVLKKSGEYIDMLRDTIVASGISLTLCPMLSVLFVATRMRALQITQQKGAPQGWAQDCMLVAVFATCVQSACCLVMPIFVGAACKTDDDGNPDYDLKPMIGAYAVTVTKYVALLALYGSVITICVAVFVMTPETAHSGVRIMNSPKAFFEACGVALLVLGIALLFSSAKVIGMAVKFAVESCDQALLGVDISIKSAALSLFKGYVSINNLVLHQPEDELIYNRDADGHLQSTATGKKLEWEEDYIIKIRTIMVKINLWRLATSLGKEFELENLSICGIHANIEKPTASLHDKNSNVEYIINHIDKLGLIPPPEKPEEVAAREKAEKEKGEKDKADKLEKKKSGLDKKEPEPAPLDIPQIIIGKIQVGDIGAGVSIKGVPGIGRIHFHPTIGMIHFDNIQRDIFGGKEDLTPGQTIACLITAITKKIVTKVTADIPHQLSEAAKKVAAKAIDNAKKAMSGCAAGCFAGMPGSPQSKSSVPQDKRDKAVAAVPNKLPEVVAESTGQGKAEEAQTAPEELAKKSPAPEVAPEPQVAVPAPLPSEEPAGSTVVEAK